MTNETCLATLLDSGWWLVADLQDHSIWLNDNPDPHYGIGVAIGGGSTNREALTDAVRTLEEAIDVLQQPPRH